MTYTREEFVKEYAGFISNAVKGTGILQGTVLAQAIIESQAKMSDGNWRVGASTLSQEANNYFGIKCHSWKGKVYNIDTGEVAKDGTKYVDKNACFRAYDSVEDSILDYIDFVQVNSNYRKAGYFEAKTVKEQAEALKRAGYATSPTYAKTVTNVYNGIANYAEKYKNYGLSGILKSFSHSPIGFIKRNKIATLATILILSGVGVGTYLIVTKQIKIK